jgi:hypothetical protein
MSLTLGEKINLPIYHVVYSLKIAIVNRVRNRDMIRFILYYFINYEKHLMRRQINKSIFNIVYQLIKKNKSEKILN